MAEEAASDASAFRNADRITSEMEREQGRYLPRDFGRFTTNRLRKELSNRGLKGFKRGGRVHRTGIYKLHRGERVVPARSKRRSRR